MKNVRINLIKYIIDLIHCFSAEMKNSEKIELRHFCGFDQVKKK
jgi:hypothetical protein